MSTIGVVYAELEELRAKLNSGSSQIQETINTLQKDLGPLRESSVGSYIEAFDQRKVQWDSQMQQLSSVLNETATKLANFGQNVSEVDSKAAKAFSAV